MFEIFLKFRVLYTWFPGTKRSVLANRPTVNSGEVSRGRVCGCGWGCRRHGVAVMVAMALSEYFFAFAFAFYYLQTLRDLLVSCMRLKKKSFLLLKLEAKNLKPTQLKLIHVSKSEPIKLFCSNYLFV